MMFQEEADLALATTTFGRINVASATAVLHKIYRQLLWPLPFFHQSTGTSIISSTRILLVEFPLFLKQMIPPT